MLKDKSILNTFYWATVPTDHSSVALWCDVESEYINKQVQYLLGNDHRNDTKLSLLEPSKIGQESFLVYLVLNNKSQSVSNNFVIHSDYVCHRIFTVKMAKA